MILEQCKGVHCVGLGESFQTHIYLQKLASIQPRTSPLKFAALFQTFSIHHCIPARTSRPENARQGLLVRAPQRSRLVPRTAFWFCLSESRRSFCADARASSIFCPYVRVYPLTALANWDMSSRACVFFELRLRTDFSNV